MERILTSIIREKLIYEWKPIILLMNVPVGLMLKLNFPHTVEASENDVSMINYFIKFHTLWSDLPSSTANMWKLRIAQCRNMTFN